MPTLSPIMAKILPLLILGITIALVMLRPGKVLSTYGAVAGAIAVFVIGLVTPAQTLQILRENAAVLLLLAGLLMVAAAAGKAGFFDWCAWLTWKAAGQNGRRLFLATIVLSALTTVFFSLDTTAVILTSVIYITAVKLRLDPVPFLYATIFTANTASLLLPVSNLTNLLLVGQLHLSFSHYVKLLAIPGTVAVISSGVLLYLYFRRRILPKFDAELANCLQPEGKPESFFRLARITVLLTLVLFTALSLADWPLYPVALVAAAFLWGAGIWYRELRPSELIAGVPWQLFFFVFGLEMVVSGVENTGFVVPIGRLMSTLVQHSLWSGLLSTVFGWAVASNLVNNIPAAVLAIAALKTLGGTTPRFLLDSAVLVGCNLGPNLTLSGSLATMLWLMVVRRQGRELPAAEFFRVGIFVTPLVLIFTALALVLNSLLLR